MARKRQQEESKASVPDYMATYGDLVTLLFCFFVLLFSMSTIEATKFEQIASALSGQSVSITQSGANDSIIPLIGTGVMQQPMIDMSVNDNTRESEGDDGQDAHEKISEMASDFKTYFAENNLAEEVEIIVDTETLRMIFKEGVVFDSGRANIKSAFYPILDIIAEELFNYPNAELRVEGHTDNNPINTVQFPSNDYLSSARAIAVVEYIRDIKGFAPERIEHVGYGEYRPIDDNSTPEGRARNRRVEIYIKTPGL